MRLFGGIKSGKIEECKKIIEEQNKMIDLLNEKVLTEQNKLYELEQSNNSLENTIKILNDKITEYQKQISEIQKPIEENGRNSNYSKQENILMLLTGKYKGGIDIPVGRYDLAIVSGVGMVEINKPEDIWFNMSTNSDDIKMNYGITEYRNLEITEKSILRIGGNAKIKFSSKKGYMEKNNVNDKNVQTEICCINEELKILNNELIERYYDFSNYNKITSEAYKNRIAGLKEREREMRNLGTDVVRRGRRNDNKFWQRVERQIIRNFNSECDNIMTNISVKNIDVVRNKIVKSFETLNKLYELDNISLSKEFLQTKLDIAVLIYTYELKKQQEKDIQQAIKEQMKEEAKAERELETQRMKIEKDLKQHLGEIRRLMKYLPKISVEVEKDIYLEKIKELEEKVKKLEAEKQAVIDRVANAKAGFVYVISNIGSFGEDVYKIGMTRRLEPMERIKELSSASVPFEFDVHAMIFSSDAQELESMLHDCFADYAINKVNPRKEFFKIDIDEIEKVVKEKYNNTVTFTKIPVAAEYRQSIELGRKIDYRTFYTIGNCN